MEKYDYYKALRNDIRSFLNANYRRKELQTLLDEDRNALYDELYERMWVADEVTGNGSGSYTFSTWEAEENICHNLDLLEEARMEFKSTGWDGAEVADVTIRCYLLGEVLNEVLDSY